MRDEQLTTAGGFREIVCHGLDATERRRCGDMPAAMCEPKVTDRTDVAAAVGALARGAAGGTPLGRR
ncbi:hypothetical protein CP970_11505 [Streptomyces kanamyceticus]|uniref:Uncharacterized protein n=1 Tax=Streptomyces kanamyceticus TaxID=1967 RepID=A0A5J6G6Q6_STRKN|nr:hypothetical protein CP970_11505 [Streptomyces kanamyceticus]